MGWVTVAAYFGTSLACFASGRVSLRDRGFWLFLTFALFLLGVNKQLDFQSGLTAIGRCASQLQGWYDDRRQFQFFFILGLLAVSGMVLLSTFVRMSARLHRVGAALLGFGMLLTFVNVRAIGFHHFDSLLKTSLLGVRVNWILELSGIALILLNAILACKGTRNITRRTEESFRPRIRSAPTNERPPDRRTHL